MSSMMSTVFILGRMPDLSRAELDAVLLDSSLYPLAPDVLRFDRAVDDPQTLISKLGGTIKIGAVIAATTAPETVADDIVAPARGKGKINFGLSWYHSHVPLRQQLAFGLTVKKILRQRKISCRLVTSHEAQLTSVVVRTNHCREYLVLPDGSLARTIAVQDFSDFTKRDVGRPHRDLKSGTLPPKLARMMVNLARLPLKGTLLDPFCGSGTILTEAAISGIAEADGVDISAKAVSESRENLLWAGKHYQTAATARWSVRQGDARQLTTVVQQKKFDAVVTEPYLGPPLSGRETRSRLKEIIDELSTLYLAAFNQFRLVLKPNGRVVFVMPMFMHVKAMMPMSVSGDIPALGFTRQLGPLPYFRDDQRVRRQLYVWSKSG